MALEVQLPSSSTDFDFEFDFDRGRASPILMSTPSSPTRFGAGFFFSTPPTPAHGSENVYGQFDTIRSPLIYEQRQQQQQQSPARKTLQSKNSKSNLWSTMTNKKPPKVAIETAERSFGRDPRRVIPSLSTSKSGKREARSLSPERRKWRLKDLLLFRSKSEGHSSHTNKDPLKRYSKIDNTRSSSRSQSIDNQSSAKRGAMVSAHELHYKTNKAIREDMKKKSFLPYKQGILGRLAVAHGFGSLPQTRG